MRKTMMPGLSRITGLGRWINLMLGGRSGRFRPGFDATRLTHLDGRLEVARDNNGVAHLYANEEADLYIALGYLQATERGFHLDFLRHLARGTLSEWRLGDRMMGVHFPEVLGLLPGLSLADIDQFVRPLGFVEEARRDLAKMDARAQGCLAGFAQGVNDAWRAGDCCPEQLLLAPVAPWLPEDCLLAARAYAFVLALQPLENKLLFASVRAEEGDALTRLLYPDGSWAQAQDIPTVSGPPFVPLPMGGNGWAVEGSHTQSGKPLLAIDPHAPLLPAPTFWHHVHLHCPGYDVQGGMYPGFPVFGFGHSARLAWGITTGFRDAWDGLHYRDCDHAAHFEGHLALMAAQSHADILQALEKINAGPFDFNIVYAHHEGPVSPPIPGGADYRQRRIEFLLQASNQHTLASMQAIQSDIGSDFANPLREVLCDMLSPYASATPLMRDSLQALRGWAGVFDVNAVGASLFSLLRQSLPAIVFGKLLGEASANRYARSPSAIPRLDQMLLNQTDGLRVLLEEKTGFPLSHWVGVAFERTVQRLTTHYGDSVPRWRWGRVQRLRIATALGDILPGATPFVALDAEFPGETNTIGAAVSIPAGEGGLRVIVGPSSRFICDLANPTEAWFAHSSGPSADPETPYFRTLSEAWSQFGYFKSALWPADAVPNVIERVIVRGTDLKEFSLSHKESFSDK